jgi:hypothetical protein
MHILYLSIHYNILNATIEKTQKKIIAQLCILLIHIDMNTILTKQYTIKNIYVFIKYGLAYVKMRDVYNIISTRLLIDAYF